MGLRGTIQDISARKLADLALAASVQALRISEKQLEVVQSISGTGSRTCNLVTNEVWGSAEGMRIFGYLLTASPNFRKSPSWPSESRPAWE